MGRPRRCLVRRPDGTQDPDPTSRLSRRVYAIEDEQVRLIRLASALSAREPGSFVTLPQVRTAVTISAQRPGLSGRWMRFYRKPTKAV